MTGLVIKSISGDYTIYTADDEIYVCKPRGVFRHQEISPKVGDRVVFEPKTKIITEIMPRKNELTRPTVSNVDKMFLIFPVKEPNLNLNLLDRMLAILEYNEIESIIVFSKVDLPHEEAEIKALKSYYESVGYKVYLTSIISSNIDLIHEFANSISVFAGQSGAGKSTLLNIFDKELNIKTQEISFALGRGKHTTRHTELHKLFGGWIADTPGFGNIDFPYNELLSLAQSFKEFFKTSNECKFGSRCLHINEPGCMVKEKVNNKEILKSRYENYLLFFTEVDNNIKNKY